MGKILAEVLGYSYFDSDSLVEQAVGMPSVAQIFKVHSEAFFRDTEVNIPSNLLKVWSFIDILCLQT